MKKKVNDFKIPENYLDSFTTKLMVKLTDEVIVEKKQDGFKVPDNYFDSLHDTLSQKIQRPQPKVVQLNPFKKYYYVAAVAAVLLIFVGLNYDSETEITFDHLEISAIESFIYEDALEFSTYELAEMLPIDEVEIKDIIENQFNDENIIDYLDNNIDNFEELNLDPNE